MNQHPHQQQSQSPLRRLAESEPDVSHIASYSGKNRWLVPYADLLTVLIGLVFLFYAAGQMNQETLQNEHDEMQAVLEKKNELVQIQQEEMSRLQDKLEAIRIALAPEVSEDDPILMLASESDLEIEELAKRQNGQSDQNEITLENNEDITVSLDDRGVVISMLDSVLFSPGDATLSEASKKTLDRLAEAISTSNNPIRVEGHTDNTPIHTTQFDSNWELSAARATHIVRYLSSEHDIAPERLSAVGYGEFRPVESNSSIEGKQKNRRVDIVLLSESAAQFEPAAEPAEQSSAQSIESAEGLEKE